MIKGNRDKPVPTEADALLAKVSALKDARDEAGGIEPHFHDSRGGGSQRQDEEAWSDHTSNLDSLSVRRVTFAIAPEPRMPPVSLGLGGPKLKPQKKTKKEEEEKNKKLKNDKNKRIGPRPGGEKPKPQTSY